MTPQVLDKLKAAEAKYGELTRLVSDPAVQADPPAYRTHSKALADLQELIHRFQDYQRVAKELTDAGADWQIHAYGHTMHAFTNPQAHSPEHGLQYNATAERRAWQAMRSFFEELFPAS